MPHLSAQDRIDITDLVNRHGHLVDAGDLDGMGELLTPDVTYAGLAGRAAVREAAIALGDANPVGHHVTNIVITPVDDDTARVRSKGLGVTATGGCDSVVYDDVVTRGPGGWRIRERTITPRRAALGGPHDVLERWRRASLDRSADGLRRVYAADAVHEFPFTLPGAPSRLEGREAIVDWIVAGWAAGVPRYAGYRTLAVHDTGDPGTVVVEQEARGEGVALPNVVVLTVRNGEIARLRDYVDVGAAAAALGHDR